MIRRLITASLMASLLLVPAAAQADDSAQSVTVVMTDTGFTPESVTVPVGGSVTWKNQGSITHNAITVGGAPVPFNTGGVGPGQSSTLSFNTAGQYFYTSGVDCLNNASTPGFPCAISYLITVAPPGAPIAPNPTPAVPASAPPAPTPPAVVPAGPAAGATMTLTDAGVTPPTVTIGLNGSVTFVNGGQQVHTATSTAESNASLPPFDSGGLGPRQSTTVGFSTPGTYLFTSAPDCFSKSNPSGFACGPYSVIVATTPAPSPGGPQPAGPEPTPVSVPGAAATVTINDQDGFKPNQVTVKAGQTVAWVNLGGITHSVVVNQNPTPDQAPPWWLPYQLPSVGGSFFDSGGIGPQQSFSFTFSTPGTFPYHSSTEPVYQQNNPNCGCTFVTYQFFGTVVVTP